jgi:hypothetical protein
MTTSQVMQVHFVSQRAAVDQHKILGEPSDNFRYLQLLTMINGPSVSKLAEHKLSKSQDREIISVMC